MDRKGNPQVSSDRKSNMQTVASSATAKPNRKSPASSPVVSSALSMKSNAATALSSAPVDQARNPNTKTLIGQEMLLIDQEGTVIQGFVPAGRVGTYELTSGSVYILSKFFGSRNKVQYQDFQTNCDGKGDLYDFLGHMKLVNGEAITDHIVLDEVSIAEKRHLCVHVQTHDEPVMKLYLWDNAAADFCQKFKSYGRTPRVLLVTTVNPKHLGETLALSTMASSRVFMDTDVQPTKDYLGWLDSNSDIANKVTATVVTKPETVTLEELFSYIKLESAKVAWFECTATIDDVVQGSAWYYISCDGCNSKAIKGPTSLICNSKKCAKREVIGVAQYLAKISVYDKSEQAVFVILGDAGKELTGKPAAELVAKYFESNKDVGDDHCVPVPQALRDAIGQTRKFIVKVSEHNLTGKTQSITVTKVLPPETPHHVADLEDNTTPAILDGVLVTGSEESGPSRGVDDSAGDRIRKASESLGAEEAKRSKSG